MKIRRLELILEGGGGWFGHRADVKTYFPFFKFFRIGKKGKESGLINAEISKHINSMCGKKKTVKNTILKPAIKFVTLGFKITNLI